MEIHTFVLGSFGVSAYVLVEGPDAVVIDAPEGAEQIVEFCEARGLEPKVLVNTHGHADHIFANADLRKRWPQMAIAIGKEDAPMLASTLRNLSLLMGMRVKSPPADRLLSDGDRLEAGTLALGVIATPGHTPGGISLYMPHGPDGVPVAFTGDALFAGGIGRTDFPGASHKALIRSIRERLLALAPQTIIYPGHGGTSTIGQEAASYPWI